MSNACLSYDVADCEIVKHAQTAAVKILASTDSDAGVKSALCSLCQWTQAEASAIAILDPTKRYFPHFWSYGTSAALDKIMRGERLDKHPKHAHFEMRAILTGREKTIVVRDTPKGRLLVDEHIINEGLKWISVVPLFTGCDCIGLMWIGSKISLWPLEGTLKTLRTFAEYAAGSLLAVANLRVAHELAEAMSVMAQHTDLQTFGEFLVSETARLTQSDVGCLALLHVDKNEAGVWKEAKRPVDFRQASKTGILRWIAATGCTPNYHKDWEVPLRKSPIEHSTLRFGDVKTISNIKLSRYKTRIDTMTWNEKFKSHACAPLLLPIGAAQDRRMGVLYCANYTPHYFTENQLATLRTLATGAATWIHLRRSQLETRKLAVTQAGVRHSLVNKVSTLASHLTVLEPGPGWESRREACFIDLEHIDAYCKNLLSLTEFHVTPRPISLKKLLMDTIDSIEGLPSRVTFDGIDELLVLADSDAFSQAFDNILGNAFEHALDGSLVCIDAFVNGNVAKVKVHNTGKNISEITLEGLGLYFVPSSKGVGHGIGVCIAFLLLEMQGARASYANVEQPSSGVTCTIELKVAR